MIPGADAAKPALLLVDDDPLISETLAFVLGRDFAVHPARSRTSVREVVSALGFIPGLALVDLGLPPTPHRPDEGFRLISELLAASPGIQIVVLSGQNDEMNARHARALGAVDFVAKPCDPQVLKSLLLRALSLDAAEPADATRVPGILGRSSAIEKLRQQIRQYSNAPFPVLVEGESGTGKELVARALHAGSPRAERPYLALNCAAISPTLVEPTLFGYAKGAFTGATSSRSGYFEDASEGTLFLDEIGELPLELQAKLLRVLENGEYQRVGETQSRVSQARVIAATNRDLRQEIQAGRFRVDLYHRLSVFTVQVPPLREMDQDKTLLFNRFAGHYASQAGLEPCRLDPGALDLWLAYPFPGNVRELRNVVIRLVTKYPGADVSAEALTGELDPSALGQLGSARGDALETGLSVESAIRILQERQSLSLDALLAQWEGCFIEAAVQLAQGNLTRAARLLGMHRTTLYSRMQTRGLAHDSDARAQRAGS